MRNEYLLETCRGTSVQIIIGLMRNAKYAKITFPAFPMFIESPDFLSKIKKINQGTL